jgi:WD40 repeat protein
MSPPEPTPTASVPPDPPDTRSLPADGPTPSPGGTACVTPEQARAAAERALNSPAPRPTPPPAEEFPTIPGYEILGVLGRGGFGIVYLARHLALNREVALKMVLGTEWTDERARARFLVEAETVAAIRHTHVLQVYDFGDAGGTPYIAMEYLRGGTLGDRLRAGSPFDPRSAAELVGKLARAVRAAHEQGIVHRDLKPANVLFDEHGGPKVTDFGLAKRGRGEHLTFTAEVAGTPAYMAPEQATGAGVIGLQADVWALGVILYECLTGSRPFDGDHHLVILQRVLSEVPARPRSANPSVPRDLELICLKCLAKEPHERYATAAALADDLDRFVRGESVSVRPAGLPERAYKWARRKPTLAAAYALAVVTAVLAAGITGAVWLWQRAEHDRSDAEAARDESARQKVVAEQARDGEQRARVVAEVARAKVVAVEYGRTIQVAHLVWRANNFDDAKNLIDGTAPGQRGWEWRYLQRLCHPDVLTLTRLDDRLSSAAFSPDGRRVVTAGRVARVRDAQTGAELLAFADHSQGINSAAFSPDGVWVVTASDDETARVWDAKTGRVVCLLRHANRVHSAAFSPDGGRVVTASDDGTARVWDVSAAFGPGSRLVTAASDDKTAEAWAMPVAKGGTVLPHGNVVTTAGFSPDGARVVSGGGDGMARVWDARSGKELLVLRGHTDSVTSAGFSPDGARVATASADWTARVWDAKTGAKELEFKGHMGAVRSVAFSQDGSRVVTGSWDQTARVWDANAVRSLLTLKGYSYSVNSAGFSPDGARVLTASADGTARVWDATIGAEVRALTGEIDSVRAAAFSPDGTRVAAAVGYVVGVWNINAGAEVLIFRGHTLPAYSVEFSPDGSKLVTASADGTARVWDAGTGKTVLLIEGHENVVNTAAFDPSGLKVITSSNDKTARVWDAKSGKELLVLKGHTGWVTGAAFSPDGSKIVTASEDGTARVWDAKSEKELFPLTGHVERLISAAFSPDGGRIVTASTDGTARVWDATTATEQLVLMGRGGFKSAAFSPDGRRVVTGGGDGMARVWDAKTGAEVLTLRGNDSAALTAFSVNAALFSPDGWQVVTAGGHEGGAGSLLLWDASPLNRAFLPKEPAPPPREVRR